MFLRPAPSRGRAEQDESETASVLDFTPNTGLELIVTVEETRTLRIKSFPMRH